jgi:hypothetical protein
VYRHTQIGYLTLLICVFAGLVVTALTPSGAGRPWFGIIVVVVVGLLFSSLTTEVSPLRIRLWFGPGFPRRSIPLAEVASCELVRNPWYYGYGIRRLPSGWLYNVSGRDAVELTLKNGGRVRIGSDEAEALRRAIISFRG